MKLFLMLVMFNLIGCAQLNKLVQSPPPKAYISNIPKDQTMVVIPFNDYINQIEVARKVEMILVNYGFSVRSLPSDFKEIEKRTDSGISGSSAKGQVGRTEEIGAEAKETTIERYRAYSPVDVQIIFEVLLSEGWITVKVVRAKDRAVIGVSKAYESNLESELEDFLLKNKLIIEKTS
ncbi:MAG: hypothetical protein KCHDKBKB_02912 [Elusimicrobia bacterium]|nr:hypothetical protein [Elusimicrobiota bacterium]